MIQLTSPIERLPGTQLRRNASSSSSMIKTRSRNNTLLNVKSILADRTKSRTPSPLPSRRRSKSVHVTLPDDGLRNLQNRINRVPVSPRNIVTFSSGHFITKTFEITMNFCHHFLLAPMPQYRHFLISGRRQLTRPR